MKIPKFESAVLEGVCKVIGDTGDGLTGSEIGNILRQSSIKDPDPMNTKWKRLANALSMKQEEDGCANNVIAFIQNAMAPSRFIRNHELFESQREELNTILSFAGFSLNKEGKVQKGEQVKTLDEVKKRVSALKEGLDKRGTHQQIYDFCREELLQDNYFHAVFEATKSIAERLREMTGSKKEGGELVDLVFKIKEPLLMINNLSSETEESEQKGFMNLIKGILGMFRNTTAHAPKIKWEIKEQDALDILSSISLIHRRLDKATRTGIPAKE